MQVHTPELTDKVYESPKIFHYNGQPMFTKKHESETMDMDIVTYATGNGHMLTDIEIDLKDDLRQYVSIDYIMLGMTYAHKGPFEYHIGEGKNAKVYKVPEGWYLSLSVKSLSRGRDSFISKKNPLIDSIHLVLPPHVVRKFAEYDCEISQVCHQQLNGGAEEMVIAYGPADAYMRQKIDTILKAREMGKVGELVCEREMELVFLYALMESVKRKKDSFDKIKEIVRESIHNAPSVKEIAKKAGISERSLHDLFKKRTGLTPRNFIQMERMQEAQVMLLQGGMCVSEVARRMGFSNVHYFSMQFKKQFGITPQQLLLGQKQ